MELPVNQTIIPIKIMIKIIIKKMKKMKLKIIIEKIREINQKKGIILAYVI